MHHARRRRSARVAFQTHTTRDAAHATICVALTRCLAVNSPVARRGRVKWSKVGMIEGKGSKNQANTVGLVQRLASIACNEIPPSIMRTSEVENVKLKHNVHEI